MNKFKVTIEIRKLLIENEDINKYVEGRIYPIVAPRNDKGELTTVGDFITYQRDEYSKDRTKFGVSAEKCNIYICIVSDNYGRSNDLASLVSDFLEGEHPTMEINLLDATEDFTAGKYIQTLLFEIK